MGTGLPPPPAQPPGPGRQAAVLRGSARPSGTGYPVSWGQLGQNPLPPGPGGSWKGKGRGLLGQMLFGAPAQGERRLTDTQELSLPDYGPVTFEVGRSAGAGGALAPG